MSSTVLRDALSWIVDEAIAERTPKVEDCGDCQKAAGTCGDHQGDADITDAMHALVAEVEAASDDEGAIAALRTWAPLVMAEIAKAEAGHGDE